MRARTAKREADAAVLQPGTLTGAEVDAIVAVHSTALIGDHLPSLPDAVARQDLTLYIAENSQMDQTGQIQMGEAVTILGRAAVAGWAKVRTAGMVEGYCPVAHLMLNVSLSDADIIRGAPTRTPSPTATLVTPTPSPTAPEADSEPSQSTALPAGNIAFAVYDADTRSYTLYSVTPDGTGLHVLADHVRHPDYSPNGARIVADGTGGGKDDLWQFASDGSDWHQLTLHPDDLCPTWSPNGLLVAFSSLRHGDGSYRLYLNDTFFRNNRNSFILGDYPVYLPTWELVFSGCDHGWGLGSRCGLWRVVERGEPAQLTDVAQDIPTDGDGEAILFLRPDEGNWDIYRVARAGGVPKRLTDNPGRDEPAAFSPDGQAIAFLSDRSGTWSLYTMSRAGSDVHKVIDLPLGGGFEAAPFPWNTERISWGPVPPAATTLPAYGRAGVS